MEDEIEAERASLSSQVEELRTRLHLRQSDVSLECGVNASMLSQWTQNRYKGNVARINRLMEIWLAEKRSGKEVITPPVKNSYNISSATAAAASASSTTPRFKKEGLIEGSTLELSDADVQVRRRLYDYPKPVLESPAVLIPIELKLDVGGKRLVDSFCWNASEPESNIVEFAENLVSDLDLPILFVNEITKSIQTQVEQKKAFFPWHEDDKKAESLHPIFLNLRVRNMILQDAFEWNVNDEKNSPEDFARVLATELGLNGEFEMAIAFSIRQQLGTYAKLRREFSAEKLTTLKSPVPGGIRTPSSCSAWGPHVYYLTRNDVLAAERVDSKALRFNTSTSSSMIMTNNNNGSTTGFPSHSPVNSNNNTVLSKEDRPPKHVNTFLMFCRKWRKTLMARYPKSNANEVSKVMGEMWQKLSNEEREAFRPLAEVENKKRLEDWKKRQAEKMAAAAASATTTNPSSSK